MNRVPTSGSSNSMEPKFNVEALPKSGFNLSYPTYPAGLVIGRLYPGTYQHIMPGDKFNARNMFNLYAEKLSTPVVSDVNVSQQNYFVRYRAIDTGFKDLVTPTKTNGMSASLSVPSFSLKDIVKQIAISFKQYLPYYGTSHTITYTSATYPRFDEQSIVGDFTTFANTYAKDFYIDDVYQDIYDRLAVFAEAIRTSTSSTTTAQFVDYFTGFWSVIFDFFCGEGSMMDYLGYPIFKHVDVKQWLTLLLPNELASGVAGFPDPSDDAAFSLKNSSNQIISVDARLVSEYPIRAMYAIWFEHYRLRFLEPRHSGLWEYHDFGPTSLFSGSTLIKAIASLLPLRPASWSKDAFNTAQIDDISRHVYAPIMASAMLDGNYGVSSKYAGPSSPAQLNSSVPSTAPVPGSFGNVLSSINLNYVDSDGNTKVLSCPVPDALTSMDINYVANYVSSYGYTALDLFTFKKAQMYERFLKRNFAYGDEYHDRMKAQYNVTLPDASILRPELISTSHDYVSVKQEVANGGSYRAGSESSLTEQYVHQGDRLATAITESKSSDAFTYFADEFGIYISIFSIIPESQFDVTCPQLFQLKSTDFPIPVFSNQQEEIMNSAEMYRTGIYNNSVDNKPFGHVPYAHAYRFRTPEVHGQTLSEKFDYTFARFFKGLTGYDVPKLNYAFVHCRPALPMFVNNVLLDGQFYGKHDHVFYVERELPEPVESI